MLESNIIKKNRVKKKVIKWEFHAYNSKKYKVKLIQDNIIYKKELKGYLLKFYYQITWTNYSKEKNIWKLISII